MAPILFIILFHRIGELRTKREATAKFLSALTSSHSTAPGAEQYSASSSAMRIHPPCNRKPKREVCTAECTTKSPTRLGVGLLCIVSQASYVAGVK